MLTYCAPCDIGIPAEEFDAHHIRMHGGGEVMGIVKHGTGEVIPEPDDTKTASAGSWTGADEQELDRENSEADGPTEEQD